MIVGPRAIRIVAKSLLQFCLLCFLLSTAAIPAVIMTANVQFLIHTEDYLRLAPLFFALCSLAIHPAFLASKRTCPVISDQRQQDATSKEWCLLSLVPIVCFVVSGFIMQA